MMRNLRKVILFTLMLQLAIAVWGFAQAWVSPRGTGSISISYQNNFVDRHLFGKGQDFLTPGGVKTSDLGEVRFQSVFVYVGYSVTDRLAISTSLPFISAKYTAPVNPVAPGFGPHALVDGTIPLDDGRYHGSFQDFDIKIRYNAWTHPFMVTPFIEYVAPSNDYMFYSHAIVGNRVRTLHIGTFLGSSLDPFLPNTYIQGRYSYGFPQKILGISRRRHNAELEVGYFVNTSIRAFGLVIGEVTSGGLDLVNDVLPTRADNPLFFQHARITRDNILNVGGGIQYSLNDTLDLYGVLIHTITARNMHALNYGITFGISWGFGGSPDRPCHC